MSRLEKILDLLSRGILPQTLALSYLWETFTDAEREDLLAQAKRLSGQKLGADLLTFLQAVVGEKDDWYVFTILELTAAQSILPLPSRLEAVNQLRKIIEKLRPTLAGDTSGKDLKTRHRTAEAACFALNARLRQENGETKKAIASFKAALALYRKLRQDAIADDILREMTALEAARKAAKTSEKSAKPAEKSAKEKPARQAAAEPEIKSLLSQRDRLLAEIESLKAQLASLKRDQERMAEEVARLDLDLQRKKSRLAQVDASQPPVKNAHRQQSSRKHRAAVAGLDASLDLPDFLK